MSRDDNQNGIDDRFELVLTAAMTLAAAAAAKRVAAVAWRAATGRTPPAGGKDANANAAVVLLWGAALGAAAGAARMLAEREAGRIAVARRNR
jgi:hypothetical protein